MTRKIHLEREPLPPGAWMNVGQPWEELQTVLSPCLYPPSLEARSPHLKNLFPARYFSFLQQNGWRTMLPPRRTWGLHPSVRPSVRPCLPRWVPAPAGCFPGLGSLLSQMRKRKGVFQRGEGV